MSNSIDWKLLVGVRERQKTTAMGVVARDSEAAAQSQAHWQQAEALHAQEIQGKAAHWQATAGALEGGRCNVAQLRHAGAWSAALDARIVEAQQLAAQAGEQHAQREQSLARSRQALREASGELEKAQQMQARTRAERAALQEQRQDEASEEAASQQWAAARRVV
ncbi:serine kinase [Variovorax sp. JS1663]|uniref:serine kinase n=1 Tax=Variovorax sp. JS1663 TaxID=1851577 RepID=UPI000B3486D4|nr:serine kinase [Variovorax sp. JS1663]OUL98715.1 serine kinase [Variovorax sp. JS1663]